MRIGVAACCLPATCLRGTYLQVVQGVAEHTVVAVAGRHLQQAACCAVAVSTRFLAWKVSMSRHAHPACVAAPKGIPAGAEEAAAACRVQRLEAGSERWAMAPLPRRMCCAAFGSCQPHNALTKACVERPDIFLFCQTCFAPPLRLCGSALNDRNAALEAAGRCVRARLLDAACAARRRIVWARLAACHNLWPQRPSALAQRAAAAPPLSFWRGSAVRSLRSRARGALPTHLPC